MFLNKHFPKKDITNYFKIKIISHTSPAGLMMILEVETCSYVKEQ
jgi:hypothetical protein